VFCIFYYHIVIKKFCLFLFCVYFMQLIPVIMAKAKKAEGAAAEGMLNTISDIVNNLF